jgi:hypothetical protein
MQAATEQPPSPSLKIERPLGGVLWRALLLLAVLLAAAEGLARSAWVQQRLEVASLGNYHYQFEIKWFQLQRYVQAHGGVDVLFLGSSLVNSGIQPQEVNRAFVEASGEPELRIFNFGVEGLTVQPNSVVARLLAESFHPGVIIFGTEIRDYAANNGVETAEKFLSDPWLRYRLGEFSLRGWLAEHSAAYRYFLAYRNWMSWGFAESHGLVLRRSAALTADGYDVENRVAERAQLEVDPSNPEDAEALAIFAGFRIDEGRLADLQALLDLQQAAGVRVLVVEMPVTPQFYQLFEQGQAAHDEFVQVVSAQVEAAGSVFYPALPEEQLPEDGRSDRVHLSKYGAAVFSRTLGTWLAELSSQPGLELRQAGGAP